VSGKGPMPPTLTPVAPALSALLDAVRPVEAIEIPITEAVGAVLAEPLVASRSVPERAIALRRGWAVASADVVGASPYSPMPLVGASLIVEAGDTLPPGVDAVLPPDAVEVEAGFVQALAEAAPGVFARRPGEDAGAGAVLRPAGKVFHARHVAIARLAGAKTCRVRRPRLLVWHDGSETAEAVARLVAVVARPAGAEAVIEAGPPGRLEGNDALMVVGGREGASRFEWLVADGLALRPGETTACGFVRGAPAIAVPALAAEALAAALVLLRPVLARLSGAGEEPPRRLPLARKMSSTVGLAEVALLREASGRFEPLGVGDLALTALARADAWLAVPPESEGFAAGEIVAASPLEAPPG
jgi:molybdopterin molybdotransferase